MMDCPGCRVQHRLKNHTATQLPAARLTRGWIASVHMRGFENELGYVKLCGGWLLSDQKGVIGRPGIHFRLKH
jgi:hypothetical protein